MSISRSRSSSGWASGLVEMLMAEYGLSLAEATWRFPIRAALGLVRPRAQRMGHDATGPDHTDRASISKRQEVMAWIEQNFRIVKRLPAQPAQPGKEAPHG